MLPDDKEWLTARHEAGHAVAALHYGCPMENVSIEAEWPALGTTRLGISRLSDAIVIFCGPLAEKPWSTFLPGAQMRVQTAGVDHDALLYLEMSDAESSACFREALVFLCRTDVQAQIDRVAHAPVKRRQMSVDDVRATAGFTHSLASEVWRT